MQLEVFVSVLHNLKIGNNEIMKGKLDCEEN